ncbi:SpoIIE family protein phosphatase [Haliangium sp.]|uniref:SpoIIE family protein phosphatase n=1 Tax=Haliangium sp. TaxID=2663208 RepID=UPI003D106706
MPAKSDVPTSPETSLVFLAGPNVGRRYKLRDRGDYILGRRSDCQIFIPDMRVSRQHARIHQDNGAWTLEDLGSNNGTFLNGERIQSVALKHEDEISIATNSIRVEMPNQQKRTRDFDSHVTIVDVKNPAIYVSTDNADASGRMPPFGDGGSSDTNFLARKLHAVQTILEIAANVADPDQLMESVVAQILEVFPQADSVGVLVEDERSHELRVKCHTTRKVKPFGGDFKVPGTIIDHVVHDRRGVLLTDSSPPSAPNDIGSGGVPLPGVHSGGARMGAPLQARNAHYGVIYVEAERGRFKQEDLDLLTSISAQTGLAIYTARMHSQLQQRQRLERDLRVARQIQRSLMRNPPRVVGLEFAIHYEPAYQIGGDFYDFIWHDDDHLAIISGDVAGKAISAALYMARLTSELRGRAGIARTPQRLIRRVNDEMVKLGDDGMFATLVCAVFELSSRSLLFTNAGHCVPLLRRGDRVFPLESERAHIPPIGVLPDIEVGEARVQMYTDDLLVIVSDGIIEARDPRGNEYGQHRLTRRIRTARGGAEDTVKAILQDVDSHVGSAIQADDMTIVAMRVTERRTRRQTTTVPGVPAVSSESPPAIPSHAGAGQASSPHLAPPPGSTAGSATGSESG